MDRIDAFKLFGKVDQTTDPQYFINFLDTMSDVDQVQMLKRRTYSLMEASEGAHLLDIGCGTGDDVRALSHIVGRTGRVVGVDSSVTMVAEARKRAEESDLPVEFHVCDVHHMDFADNTFDACRAERVLVHLDNPRLALTEMIRIVRVGGRIVVYERDQETIMIASENRSVTRKVLNARCDSLRNGWIGRELQPLFRALGLIDIAVLPETQWFTDYALFEQLFRLSVMVEQAQSSGVITAGEAAEWLNDLQERHRVGQFFVAATGFTVSGRKPSLLVREPAEPNREANIK